MNYEEYSDGELYALVCEQDEDAKDMLYTKYKYIIDIVIKRYAYSAMKYGLEYGDLYQEALVGFSDALTSFDGEKNSALPTFITLCVDRKLQNTIRKAARIKNQVLLDSLSLDHVYEDYNLPLKDLISDHHKNDPLSNITKDEEFDELVQFIEKALSPSEYEVYKLLIAGLTYQDIAKVLNRSTKQIDNAIQRIKSKVKDILENRQLN